ncbi:MAG TPA: NTP transferase domain-containing protein [Candidatus Elarobacter sp.]|jgi:CTP:molybdopterin cytidylyltransferase MocA|nr:NTP transferase domain-containing protein [Candidatus Elarobacter sp.]
MRAVITAGGTVDGAFAEAAGTPVKALARFGARTLLDVALDACAAAGIGERAVVGGPQVRAHLAGRDVRVLDAVADGRTNLLRALDAWPGERIVFLTSDLPFVSGDGLRDFVARSAPFAVTMALADVEAYTVRFPDAPEHSVAIGGERVANGNAFVIAPEAVAPLRAFATRFFAARKSLPRMALLLGPSLIARYVTKRLTIAAVEAHASRRLGVPVAAVRGCDPGLCYDVDTVEEYAYAQRA